MPRSTTLGLFVDGGVRASRMEREDDPVAYAGLQLEDRLREIKRLWSDTNNAEILAQTFGHPIGDQSWRYGRRGGGSDYGGCAASPARGCDWYDK